MYNFLLLQWKINEAMTKERLQSYVPTFVTQEEYEQIIAIPREVLD